MKKRTLITILAAITAAVSLFLSIQNSAVFTANPIETTQTLDYPSFAATATGGDFHIIDRSRRRVTTASADGTIRYSINGGSREAGTFFYAGEVAPGPDGSMYLLNQVLDKSGFFTEKEEILHYAANGALIGSVFSRQYPAESRTPTLVQRGRLMGLSVAADGISVFELSPEGIIRHRIRPGTAAESALPVPLKDADLLVSGVSAAPDGSVYYISKKAGIFRYAGGAVREIRAAQDGMPWMLGIDALGGVYYTDLASASLKRLIPDGTASDVISEAAITAAGHTTGAFTYYRLSVSSDGRVTTCNDEQVVSYAPARGIDHAFAALSIPRSMIAIRVALWGMALLGVAALVFLLHFVYRDILGGRIPGVLLNALGIIVIIGISAAVVSTMTVRDFSARYQKEALNKIAQIVQIVPKVIDVNRLEKVRNRADFMGDDYRKVREQILSALNYNRDEWNNHYYFVLYRIKDNQVKGLMYLNGEIGLDYPFSYFDDEESVYRTAYGGTIATEGSEDIYGSWLYGVGPVTNEKGEVVALLEIGTDLYTFNVENSRLAREIILDVLTMLVILVLVMIEFTFFVDMVRKREAFLRMQEQGRKTARHSDQYSDAFLIRPLSFLFSTAASVSVAFIPIMARRFHTPDSVLSETLMTGLPLSAEMLFFGLSTLVSGSLAGRFGWRRLIRVGFGLTAAGLLLSALAPNIGTFIAARGLAGFGAGAVLLAMRSFINLESDEGIRNDSYASFYAAATVGLSIGAVIGGLTADKFGFAGAFYAGLGILAIAAFFELNYLRHSASPAGRDDDRSASAIRTFALNRGILAFFFLIIMPTYAASSFLTYFFPLFAENAGLTTADIGRLFILNGLFVIYLGPALGSYLNRRIGFRVASIAGSLAWAAALVVFALTGNIAGAVVALVCMGITEGFCVSAQNGYFMSLDAVKRIGANRAVGYFELAGKFGETASPLIFAGALTLGQNPGIAAIAGGVTLCTIAFMTLRNGGNK